MSEIFFSVVIPLFNKQDSIIRALSSVLDQEYQNFEIIIVNDGSTDASREKCLPFVDGDKVVLIDQDNAGVSVARNKGILASRYKHICFLDADDEWLPSFLQKIKNLFDQNEGIIFCAARYSAFSGGKFLSGYDFPKKNFSGVIDNFFYRYTKSRSLVCSSSVCVLKNSLLNVGLFPEGIKTGEDVYVWLRLGLIGKFAFDSSMEVVVHFDAENRTFQRVAPEIPYYLNYFLINNYFHEVSKGNAFIYIFLMKYSIIYSLEWIRLGYRRLVIEFSKNLRQKNLLLSFFIYALSFLPKKMILFIKRVR